MKTVIEINGRKYDARTGELLSGNQAATNIQTAQTAPRPAARPASPARASIDGVNRRKPVAQAYTQSTPTPAVHSQTVTAAQIQRPKPQRVSTAKTLDIKPSRHNAERAKTLLRTVVKKPQKTAPQIHSTSTIAESKVERSATGRGLLLKRVPDTRLARAKMTAKSLNIRKFGSPSHSKDPVLSASLTVTKEPKVALSAPAAAPAITKPVLGKHDGQKQQVFQHSIAQSTHHTAAKIKKDGLYKRLAKKMRVNPRLVSVGAASIAVLVLASFLAYQNIPAVAMKVAASKAGFSGHLPSDTPSGFSFKGPIRYDKNSIAVQFSSNTDERSFVLLQKPSDWTSDSLLTNYVLTNAPRYQTYHSKGLTVFIYNNGDATWVDKGVWYSVNGNGALSSDQILSMASSM